MSDQLKLYAIVTPGLEKIAAKELEQLSAHQIHIETGGISFSGSMQLLFRVNLRSRTITRVLMRLRTFRSMTLEGLGYDLRKVAWHLFLNENSELDIKVSCHRSRLNHTDEIAAFCKQEIENCIPKIKQQGTHKRKQTLYVRIENNRGTLSLDSSGERLDRRGYRLESGKAPIRETLAAAILHWSGWSAEQTLLNPMCGSGTFAIEAALIATRQAPNLSHDFAFLHWPSSKPKEFKKVLSKTAQMTETGITTNILASDINSSAVEFCNNNAARAGVAQLISVKQMDIHQLAAPDKGEQGVLLLNPPYGQRISERNITLSLWRDIGTIIKRNYAENPLWKTIIVCPDTDHERALHAKVKRRFILNHGGNSVAVLEI